MRHIVEKLAAKTDDTQDVWLRLVCAATFGLLGVLWILRGILHGPFHMRAWIDVVQFWTGVVVFPFNIFLTAVNIQVLRKVRRRELDASLAD